MALLDWLLDRPNRLTRLGRRTDRAAFAEAFAVARLTFLGLPDGVRSADGLDPAALTPESLLAATEAAARCLSERQDHTPLRLEVGGEMVFPLFTSERYAQRFVEAHVQRVNRVVPFFLLGSDGDAVAASVSAGEVVLLNPGTRHELRLAGADLVRRLNRDTALDLDPSVQPDCPACQARLALGQVDKQGHAFRTNTGREFVMPAQTAECPACRRSFSRFSLGKVWSSWAERQDAEPGAAADGGGM